MHRLKTKFAINSTIFNSLLIIVFAFTFAEKPWTKNDDGPYVFWVGQNAFVEYIKDSVKVSKVFPSDKKFTLSVPYGNKEFYVEIENKTYVPDQEILSNVEKIFAVSDIHGKFNTLTNLLKGNGVIDENLNWTYGKGHLVVIGDIFDRGDLVPEAYWLIYRLEQLAEKSGGKVHYILGNHDMMILRGDIRYVNKKYLDMTTKLLKIKYQDLFGKDSELGRWLRSKNTIVKIDDNLFVHGGISPELIQKGYSISEINSISRAHLDDKDYEVQYNSEPNFIYGTRGPFWYRGLVKELTDIPLSTEGQVTNALSYFNVNRIIVGHTTLDSLSTFFSNRVIAIDAGIMRNKAGEALICEQNKIYKTNPEAVRKEIK